ncbi:MAG: hypothetical protein ACE5QW_07135 [Thermoplasmata archaeon]
MEDDGLRSALVASWEIVLNGVAKDEKALTYDKKESEYRLGSGSRTKLRSLSIAIQEKERPEDRILHLIKFAEYMLPRSDLNNTCTAFLNQMRNIRKRYGDNPQRFCEVIEHMVGYTIWSLDSVCNVFNIAENDDRAERELRTMLEVELGLVGERARVAGYLERLMDWRKKARKGR